MSPSHVIEIWGFFYLFAIIWAQLLFSTVFTCTESIYSQDLSCIFRLEGTVSLPLTLMNTLSLMSLEHICVSL